MKIKHFFLVFLFVSSSNIALASHAAGMDLTYECLTTDTVWTGNYQVIISTQAWGNECAWNIIDDSTGAVVASGSGYNNNLTYTINVCIPSGNYTFNWFDSWGDGWHGGSYTVTTNTGTVLTSGSPPNGSSGSSAFTSPGSSCTYTVTAYPANTYRVTLKFYRDCSNGISAPSTFSLGYSSNSCNYSNSSTMNQVSFQNITPVCASITNPCGPSIVGIEEYIYQTVITLPHNCPDWVFSACESTRNNAINTIMSPGAQNLCIQSELNNTQYCNNSPVFTEYPTPYLCVNQQFCYNNGAVDPDGDSLVYTLITPLNSAVGGTVTYIAPFSASNPISGTTTFDPLTGDLCMLATQVQVSVVAMKVSEYRNGVFIGSVIRDIQIIIMNNCSTTPPVLTGINGSPQDVTTATVSDITIDHCSNGIDPIIFTINASLGASNDKTMTWGGLSAPTTNLAAFVVDSNNTNNPTGTFTWIPDYADVPNSPFYFTVTVVDDACPINNLFSFTYTLNLTSNSGFTVQDTITNESCPGDNDGAIDIIITGISGSPTFSWTGPNGFVSSAQNISGLSTGLYVLELTSPDGCIVSYTYNVLSNSVSLSETHSNPTCSGLLNGSIDLSIFGGISPYFVTWIDSTSNSFFITEDLTNIGPGNYWCTVTDSIGCDGLPLQVVITEPDAISTNPTLTDITCSGGADGGIALNAIGGNPPLSISWTGPNGFSSTLDPLFFLEAGAYYAVITDANNCPSLNEQLILSEPSAISASYTANDISCFGLNNGSIDLSIFGGISPYSVTWQGPNGFFSNTEDITNLNPGLYTLNVSDANFCSIASIPVPITEPNEITYNTTPTNVSCYGQQDGAIDLTLNGGAGLVTVSWVYPSGFPVTTEDLNGLSSGSYTFTITDANGCTPTILPLPITITEPLQILITANIQNEQCYGNADGFIDITVTNANGPFNYNWIGPLSFTDSIEDIVGLNAGSYQITVTDNSNFCTEQASFVVSSGAQMQVQLAINDVNCFNGTDGFINLIPQGLSNPVYAWSNGEITEDIFNLQAGNYSVLVNDDANCPSYFAFVVNQPNILGLTSNVTEVSCPGGNNGEINVAISGGTFPYNYVWSNGNTTPINQFLTEGVYILSVYDVNNCVVQDSFELVTDDFHVTATIIDPKCFGATDGLVDVEIIGGDYPFTYIWSNGQTNQDVVNLSAGPYSLSVTDALNCTIDTLIFVNQPPIINAITTTNNVMCFGDNTGSVGMQITGGNPPYVVDWGNVDTSAMYAGIYPYQITDSTACIYNNTVSILQSDSIGISYIKTDVQCYAESTGMIDIQILQGSGMAPYQYSWTGPNLFSSSSEDISNLVAGIYILQITDANNCTKEVHIVVDEPTPLNQIVTITTSDYTGFHIACKGDNSGWINLEINGGYIPFTYAWNTGATTDSLSNLYAGNYNVTVTDGLGCLINYSLNLLEPTTVMSGVIAATTDYNNYEIRCFGNQDGAIEEIVTGGAGNYTYQWNNGYNSDSIFNLSSGYYEVIVHDNNGCFWMDSITLNQPDPLGSSILLATDTCEREVGYAEVALSGGVPPYTYLWSSGQTTPAVYDLAEGMYGIAMLDKNLCEISNVAVIENLPSPTIDFKRLPKHKRFYDQMDHPFVFVDVSDTYWQNVVDWQWDFGDNTFGEDSIAFHSYAVAGEYTISLAIETQYNCWDTISKKILIDEYDIFIPNAFTPLTGDVMNDEFKAYGYGIVNYTMKIYSRWGEILFESDDINRGWNGTTRNGEGIAPTGVYLYFIEVENIYGEIFIYQDALKLMR